MRSLTTCSELEYLVLAMVAQGISSGYAMRKFMSKMRGGRWSTESGSIYRALKRLQQGNLVYEKGRAGAPNRQRTEYALSPKGELLLQTWLTSAPPQDDLAALNDPIRTRSHFLGLMESRDRVYVVKTWVNHSKAFVESLRREASELPADDRSIEALALHNLLLLAEARHEWLRKLLSSLRTDGTVAMDDERAFAQR